MRSRRPSPFIPSAAQAKRDCFVALQAHGSFAAWSMLHCLAAGVLRCQGPVAAARSGADEHGFGGGRILTSSTLPGADIRPAPGRALAISRRQPEGSPRHHAHPAQVRTLLLYCAAACTKIEGSC